MSFLDALHHRTRAVFRRADVERELDEEFRFHVALDGAQQPGDATTAGHAARKRFGRLTYFKEELRRMTLHGTLDVFRQDIRYAWRGLVRAPAFTLVAVLSLGIAIGANTTIFGLINSVLLAPLPVPHPEQLVEFQRTDKRGSNPAFAWGEYQAMRTAPGLSAVSSLNTVSNIAVQVGEDRDYVNADLVGGDYFALLGLKPLRGRLLTPEDERLHASVVVIGEALWERLFNRSADALGGTMLIHGAPFTVVGILPRSYHGLQFPGFVDMAVPMTTATLAGAADPMTVAGSTVQIIGRLGTRRDAARAETALNATYQGCCASGQYINDPKSKPVNTRLTLRDITHGIPFGKADLRAIFGRLLLVMMGGVVVLLLIACANLGSLLLARAAARQRELAVRLSLGASRLRLVRQMLTESAMLALLGAGLGLLLAAWGTSLMASNLPGNFAKVADLVQFHIDQSILAFTALTAMAAVLVFGMVPALRATRTDLVSPLKERGNSQGGGGGSLNRGIVIAQVAMALLLVSTAGLFVTTLRNLRNMDAGFATSHVLGGMLDTRGTSWEAGGMNPIHASIIERVRALPGVRATAMSELAPMFGGRMGGSQIEVPGYAPAPGEDLGGAMLNAVTPGYFDVAGISLLGGRDFDARDDSLGEPVVIISESMARKYFQGRKPLGAAIRLVPEPRTRRIVGIAHDAKYMDLRSDAPLVIYAPLLQSANAYAMVVSVATPGDPNALAAAVRREITRAAPGLRLRALFGVDVGMNQALASEQLAALLATVFGAVALGLAAVGLYGVVSYNVARRTAEIGVRMALGARPADVVWMVFRSSLLMVGIGVAIGAPLTLAVGKVIASLLYGIGSRDPLLLGSAVLLLVLVALSSSALPARRASRVDPLVALRSE